MIDCKHAGTFSARFRQIYKLNEISDIHIDYD